MNFKVDIDKSPNVVSFLLFLSEVLLLCMVCIAVGYFVIWDIPSNSYLRALLVNVIVMLVCAYFNKENK